MLPDYARDTLENVLIPFKGMLYCSIVLTATGYLGAATLPEKPAAKMAQMAAGSSVIGVISGLFSLGISQSLIQDSRKRVELLSQQYPEAEWELNQVAAFSPEQLESCAAGLLPNPQRPVACRGCENYHGKFYHGAYGVHQTICAMHPYGSTGVETCPDWEPEPTEYRLIRLQGAGWSNLYFVRTFAGLLLSETFQEAIEVSRSDQRRLIGRFRLKHSTGLPGCVFKSKASTITGAYEELINSCPE